MSTSRFVNSCRNEGGGFNTEIAKLQLKSIWQIENAILGAIDNYPKLRAERNLGEMYPTESVSVSYDFLGHLTLYLVARFSKWKDYIMSTHEAEVRTLASFGSWSARDLLGVDRLGAYPSASDEELADRFFYGDVAMLRALRQRYAG